MINPGWKVTLVILSLTALLMGASYTMLIPFLPMYLIQELGVDESQVNTWSSLVFSVSFLVSAVMAPVWGALADRKSKKLMAVRAAAFLAVGYAWGGFVQTPWELFAMRVFQGFAAGLWPMLLAIMSSSCPRQRLGFALGLLQAGNTSGAVFGPLAGGLLAEFFGMRSAFIIAGCCLAFITLVLVFCVREPPRAKPALKRDRPPSGVLSVPAVQRMLLAACVVQFSILFVQPVLPLYIADLQQSMDKIVLVSGIVFSIVGISGVLAAPVWGVVGQNIGFRPTLYIALFVTGVLGVIQALPASLEAFTAWRFVFGLAFAGIFPAINSVLTQSTDASDRGKVFGYCYAAQQVGSIVGPLAGGAVASCFSNRAAVGVSGAVLLPIALFLFVCRPKGGLADRGSGKPINHEHEEDQEK